MNSPTFLQMFSQYAPESAAEAALCAGEIIHAEVNMENRGIAVELDCAEYVPWAAVRRVEQQVQKRYNLRNLSILAKFPREQLHRVEFGELMDLFVEQNPMHRGALAGATWEWQGDTLRISLRANGKKDLEESARAVRERIIRRCGAAPQFRFEAGRELE